MKVLADPVGDERRFTACSSDYVGWRRRQRMPEMTREGWEQINQEYAELTVRSERMRTAIIDYMVARGEGDIIALEDIHDRFNEILQIECRRARRPDGAASRR